MTVEKPWEVTATVDGNVHVVPDSDEVVHDLDENCLCGPALEHEQRPDGADGWIVIHHSLDGREKAEAEA